MRRVPVRQAEGELWIHALGFNHLVVYKSYGKKDEGEKLSVSLILWVLLLRWLLRRSLRAGRIRTLWTGRIWHRCTTYFFTCSLLSSRFQIETLYHIISLRFAPLFALISTQSLLVIITIATHSGMNIGFALPISQDTKQRPKNSNEAIGNSCCQGC